MIHTYWMWAHVQIKAIELHCMTTLDMYAWVGSITKKLNAKQGIIFYKLNTFTAIQIHHSCQV